MHYYAIIRIAFACFLMYLALPYIPQASTKIEFIFWTVWMMFFFFIVGGNVATLLRINRPPVIEQRPVVAQEEQVQKRHKQG